MKMNLKKGRLILLFSYFFYGSIQAYADNYIGCGLGSMIWRQNSILSAIPGITTNQTFSSQLFGISSGTSGCTQHGLVKRDMMPVYYAEANMENLRREMSLGKGENVTTFAETFGCKNVAKDKFAAVARKHYQELSAYMNAETVGEFVSVVKDMMSTEEELKKHCSLISLFLTDHHEGISPIAYLGIR